MRFELITEKATSVKDITIALQTAFQTYLGTLGLSQAGVLYLEDKYQNNQGILRVNHKFVDHIRAALAMITQIGNNPAIVRSVRTSGILKKV